MQQNSIDPYATCPVYETEHFMIRLVQLEDAQDLLACYGDLKSAQFFNIDNCTSNMIYQTVDEMNDCIRFWLDEYGRQYYVRFSIIDKSRQKAIGTFECFAKPESFANFGKVGILRIDLASAYETCATLSELLNLVEKHFYACFGVQSMVTKAIPQATERIAALKQAGYVPLTDTAVVRFGDYFVKTR